MLLVPCKGNDGVIAYPLYQWFTPQVPVDDAGQSLGVAEIDRVGGIDMTYHVHVGR